MNRGCARVANGNNIFGTRKLALIQFSAAAAVDSAAAGQRGVWALPLCFASGSWLPVWPCRPAQPCSAAQNISNVHEQSAPRQSFIVASSLLCVLLLLLLQRQLWVCLPFFRRVRRTRIPFLHAMPTTTANFLTVCPIHWARPGHPGYTPAWLAGPPFC